MNTNFSKNIILWILIGISTVMLFNMFQNGGTPKKGYELPISELYKQVSSKNVREVVVQGPTIVGELKNGQKFTTYAPNNPKIIEHMIKNDVLVTSQPKNKGGNLLTQLLLSSFPVLLLIGVWIFFMRQMQAGSGKAMGFGKSRARLLTERKGQVTFADVAGIDEAKYELEEIVDFLKDPQKFQRLGGKIPRGVLLVGSPGTGKTLLARAIAGEANVPFFSISGSDFVEMFVGVGASRVRDMFEQGKKNAPCLIFIDEIDAVGRHRGAGHGGGNDEREQTLNQLLVEMDGFEGNEGVILIAATNRPDVLDPALLRPGRFDRQVVVPLPDVKGREQILSVHMQKVPLAPDVNPHIIARGTPGFSGADLANLVNEAALLAARQGRRVVSMQQLEEAKDKVMMGAERRSMAMSDDEKKLTAYHEGGHAIVALHCPASDPIHKATIIPRGRALGLVMRLPENDRISLSRDKIYADLAVAMGGRVAEEIIFGHEKVTTGASSDIQMATDMAKRMVMEWGLSEELGPVRYAADQGESYLGGQFSKANVSGETAKKIDAEVRKIVDDAYKKATKILKDNMDQLHTLAKGLLEYETLSGDEIKDVLNGKTLDRKDVTTETSAKSSIPTSAKKKAKPAAKKKPAKPMREAPQDE